LARDGRRLKTTNTNYKCEQAEWDQKTFHRIDSQQLTHESCAINA